MSAAPSASVMSGPRDGASAELGLAFARAQGPACDRDLLYLLRLQVDGP